MPIASEVLARKINGFMDATLFTLALSGVDIAALEAAYEGKGRR